MGNGVLRMEAGLLFDEDFDGGSETNVREFLQQLHLKINEQQIMVNLAQIQDKLTNLRQGKSNGRPALHKPFLLLSVIDSVDHGEIVSNQIRITPLLISRFDNYVKTIGGNFSARFYQPFFHLHTSGFWHLKLLPGKTLVTTEKQSIKGLKPLKDNVDYAYFDEDTYSIISIPSQREVLKKFILKNYICMV